MQSKAALTQGILLNARLDSRLENPLLIMPKLSKRFMALLVAAMLGNACSDRAAGPTNQNSATSSSASNTGLQKKTPKNAQVRFSAEVDQQEKRAIEESASLASREVKTLKLNLQSGKTLELTDSDDCENPETCKIHVYRGLVAGQQFFNVMTQFYEGSQNTLISRKSGKVVEIFGDAHVSPDGKFIATASEADGYDQGGAFLWEISQSGELIQRHAQDSATNLSHRFLRWDGSNSVELLRIDYGDEKRCVGGTLQMPVKMVIGSGEFWKFEEQTDAKKMVCTPNS